MPSASCKPGGCGCRQQSVGSGAQKLLPGSSSCSGDDKTPWQQSGREDSFGEGGQGRLLGGGVTSPELRKRTEAGLCESCAGKENSWCKYPGAPPGLGIKVLAAGLSEQGEGWEAGWTGGRGRLCAEASGCDSESFGSSSEDLKQRSDTVGLASEKAHLELPVEKGSPRSLARWGSAALPWRGAPG